MRKNAHTPTYKSWSAMKDRCNCFDPKHPSFIKYAARGIRYQESWESYDNFLQDMGERPLGMTLERRDNNKGYTKENCKWALYSEQNLNRRTPKNNASGVKGVAVMSDGRFYASAKQSGRSFNLYLGNDFFQAVCARKSWETRNIFR